MNRNIRRAVARLALIIGPVVSAGLIPVMSTPTLGAFPVSGTANAVATDPIQLAQAAPPAGEASGFAAMVAAADIAAGQTTSFQCIGCHTFGEGEAARVGPNLYGVVGRPVASVDGFAYSDAMKAAGADGGTWNIEFLNAFLTAPQTAVPGTIMGFGGIADDTTRANLIGYLVTLGETPSGDGLAVAATDQRPVSYSTEQADRGQNRYKRECEECHGEDLGGGLIGGPPLRGVGFEQKYANGTPASVLFGFMSTAMPPQSPGRFSAAIYADLMAYILQQNGFAAGDELPSDLQALSNLIVER
jgi:cytochrome c2